MNVTQIVKRSKWHIIMQTSVNGSRVEQYKSHECITAIEYSFAISKNISIIAFCHILPRIIDYNEIQVKGLIPML